jgi:hydrogenase nickel incorporation protein HypA/HybF
MGVAQEIHRISREAADANGGGRLTSVTVAVGELSAIEPAHLEFAWEAITTGGPDAGSRLAVEWRPARQFCAACGEVAERAPGTWLRLCPRCDLPLRIEGGDELDVLHVDFTQDAVDTADTGEVP